MEELSDSVNVVMQWDEHNETLSQRTHSKRTNRTAQGRRCAAHRLICRTAPHPSHSFAPRSHALQSLSPFRSLSHSTGHPFGRNQQRSNRPRP